MLLVLLAHLICVNYADTLATILVFPVKDIYDLLMFCITLVMRIKIVSESLTSVVAIRFLYIQDVR